MARRTDFFGARRAIAGGVAQTITFTSSDIPSEGVIAWHFSLHDNAAVANTLADIGRIRVYANGQPIINITSGQLQAYLDSFSRGLIPQAAGSLSFSLPMFLLDALASPDEQDICQFPFGANVTVDVEILATAVAGSLVVGWTQTDVAPMWYPRLLSQVMNIPAGVTSQRFNISEPGMMRGIWIVQTGVARMRVVLGGEQVQNLPGDAFPPAGVSISGNLIVEAQRMYGAGFFNLSPFVQLNQGRSAIAGSSYIELDTDGALWAGVANECVTYAIAPVQTG